MLETLLGSRSVEQVLLFLFVNNRCYGAQLQRALSRPLTPLQRALNRLEEGGIVLSYYEGKTRLYHFNPAYPLMGELEQLLRKAFALLPSHEKRCFYVMEQLIGEGLTLRERIETLQSFWEQLKGISHLIFDAKTRSQEEGGWNGRGRGTVCVKEEDSQTLIFHEKGSWQSKQGTAEVGFSNAFRWRLDRREALLSLEHLRMGVDHPVFLFHLIPSGKQLLSSVHPHLCAGDSYFGHIRLQKDGFLFHWRAIGPNKNEEISYHYF